MSKHSLKLIVDTRETLPLKFRDGIFDSIVREKLSVGDYGLYLGGQLIPIIAERKAFGDLYSTMGQGYKRFKREMMLAKKQNIKLVLLIEGSMREVAGGYRYSKTSGDSMLKKLAMLYVRYDLESHFFNDRYEMSRWIEEVFSAVGRNYKK